MIRKFFTVESLILFIISNISIYLINLKLGVNGLKVIFAITTLIPLLDFMINKFKKRKYKRYILVFKKSKGEVCIWNLF